MLRTVQDHPYISELVDVIEEFETGYISIVYNHYQNTATSKLMTIFNDRGNKFFLYKILKALEYTHS